MMGEDTAYISPTQYDGNKMKLLNNNIDLYTSNATTIISASLVKVMGDVPYVMMLTRGE